MLHPYRTTPLLFDAEIADAARRGRRRRAVVAGAPLVALGVMLGAAAAAAAFVVTLGATTDTRLRPVYTYDPHVNAFRACIVVGLCDDPGFGTCERVRCW